MESAIFILFWILLYLPVHTYLIYPVTIGILSILKRKNNSAEKTNTENVSILISVYNEEKVIENRIRNIAELNFDFNKLEVIIGSDGSTDRTNEILQKLKGEYKWLKILLFNNRRGKSAVVNDLAASAKNNILIFTDANTVFAKNAVTKLVMSYSSSNKIGGVCGRLILEEPKNNFHRANREKAYWDYETLIKRFEGGLGILISSNGGIYSVKRKLFKPIPTAKAVTDDLYTTLSVLNEGYDFLYNYDATASEKVSNRLNTEFKRKIRFAATNFETLSRFKNFLAPKRILLSYAFWSHKVIRWFLPFLLILLFLCNLFLFPYAGIFQTIFYAQCIFYFLALVGFLFSLLNFRIPIVSIITFFCISNIALAIGFIHYLQGKNKAEWEPTPR